MRSFSVVSLCVLALTGSVHMQQYNSGPLGGLGGLLGGLGLGNQPGANGGPLAGILGSLMPSNAGGMMQGGMMPNGMMSNGMMPNGMMPNGMMPNGMMPNGMMGQNMMGQNPLQGLTQTLGSLLNGAQGQMGQQGMAMNQESLSQVLSRLSRSSLELLQRVINRLMPNNQNGQLQQQASQMQQQPPQQQLGLLNNLPAPLNGLSNSLSGLTQPLTEGSPLSLVRDVTGQLQGTLNGALNQPSPTVQSQGPAKQQAQPQQPGQQNRS